MLDSILPENPYEKIYRALEFHKVMTTAGKKQAQEVVRHIGLMYNIFGEVIKDFVKIVSVAYKEKNNESNPQIQQEAKQSKKGAARKKKQSKNNKEKQRTEQLKQNCQSQKVPKHEQTRKPCGVKPKNEENKQMEPKDMTRGLQIESSLSSKTNSQLSLITKQQKKMIKQSEIIRDLPQFNSQFFNIQSPLKTHTPQNLQDSQNIFQLSHKQKFIEPDYGIIQQQQQEDIVPNIVISQPATTPEMQQIKVFSQNLSIRMFQPIKQEQSVRMAVGKKKKDREKLNGIACIQCEKYYSVMSTKKDSKMCDCTSRHRSNLPVKKHKHHFTQEFDL